MGSDVKNKRVNIFIDQAAAEVALNKLQQTADKLNKKIAELQASGKSAAAEMKKLGDTNESIKKIQDQIDKGLGPSITQQKNLIRQLNNELQHLPINTQEFIDKLKEIEKQQSILDQVNSKVKNLEESQKKAVQGEGLFSKVFWANFLANQAQKIIRFIQNIGRQAIQSALQSEGIKRAFDRLNDPGLLDKLREATRGTVSDLELMKRAVQANNFQIPLQTLGTLLAFAQRRARDTGESVDYLVESIVTGIARKSPLILDNLGINIQRIQKEFEKTGDFAKAALNVVNQELEKAGPAIDTTADKVDRFKALWNNFLTSVGDGLLSIGNYFVDNADLIFGGVDAVAKHKADEANQAIAQENENFRNAELSVLKDYQTRYAAADQKGRDKIIEQVKAEIEYTKRAEATALIQGQDNLANNLAAKLELWQNYLNNINNASNSTNTIAAIESELSLLQTGLKNLEIGSQKFIQTQTRIKELQKQLDDATGKTAEDAKKHFDDLQNELSSFNKKLRDLQQQSQDASKSKNQKEIDDAKHKYDEIFIEYDKLQKKIAGSGLKLQFSKDDLQKLENDEIAGIIQKQTEEALKIRNELIKKNNQDEYDAQVAATEKFFEDLKVQESERYTSGAIDKKSYEANILLIDQRSKEQQIQNAKDYAATVENAQKDIAKFEKDALDAGIKATDALYKKRKENEKLLQDLDKEAALSSAKARVNIAAEGSQEELDAKKNLLKVEYDEEVKAILARKEAAIIAINEQYQVELELNKKRIEDERKIALLRIDPNDPNAEGKKSEINQRFDQAIKDTTLETATSKANALAQIDQAFGDLLKINFEDFQKKVGETQNEFIKRQVDKWAGYANSVVDILDTINKARQAKENAALQKELDANEQRKKAYKAQLDSKLISQTDYDRKIAAIDKDSAARQEALKKQQFERDKKFQLAHAIISGAAAIINGFLTIPFIPAGIIAGALATALTAVQIATIESQHYARGGKVEDAGNGKITKQSNIPTQPNGDSVLATVKPGEVILNEEQQRAIGGPEIFRQIGVPGFAAGGRIRPAYQTRSYQAVNYPKINKSYEVLRFADGGRVTTNGNVSTVTTTDPMLIETLNNMQMALHRVASTQDSLERRLSKPIDANVSLKKFDDAEAQRQRINTNSQFQ